MLQKITYKKQVVITLSKIEELLNYLLIHLWDLLVYTIWCYFPWTKLVMNSFMCFREFQDDGTKYRLGLLSNLTFKTPIIQSFIKSKVCYNFLISNITNSWFYNCYFQENLKAILKKLMSYMSNSNSKIQIFAISILSNLCLHDEVGNKVSKLFLF